MLDCIDHARTRSRDNALLSIIVPCFNEEAVIDLTHQQLTATLSGQPFALEIVYVNDGSRDRTLARLRDIARRDERVKLVSLSRNFGHQLAVTAGIDHCRGDVVAIIDADLQDPPEVILEMLGPWEAGADVVYGQRIDRPAETWFKRASAACFYRVLNSLSDTPIPLDTGDFRLLDRRVVEAVKRMPERDRFLRGMISWVGFTQTPIYYRRHPRAAGESKYPLRKMIRFALDGIFSFSSKPLKLATWIGLTTSVLAVLGIIYAVALRLFTQYWVSGWTFLVVAILLVGGIQLLFLGIIGEYIARIYSEGKGRPLYLVGEVHGFGEDRR